MGNIVVCNGTVGETTVAQGTSTAYVATCSQSWDVMQVPPTALDGVEFAGFFFGVLISTLTFYFVGVLPLGAFLRFVRQSIRNLL